MNILILGCGKIGQCLAHQLQQYGHHITTVSRTVKHTPHVQHLCQDIHQLCLATEDAFDWVYVIVTPEQSSVQAYQHIFVDTAQPVFEALQQHPIQRVVFISSTRVYGEDTGQWIDDDTLPQTQDPIGQCLIAAEQLWSAYWQDRLTIIRPSGLYQAESPYLTRLAVNATTIDTQHWTNRIHREDLVEFLVFLTHISTLEPSSSYSTATFVNTPSINARSINTQSITHAHSNTLGIGVLHPSYILSDQQPTLQHEMINRIRQRQGLTTLEVENDLPVTGKRLSATRLLQSGYLMHYPTDQRFKD